MQKAEVTYSRNSGFDIVRAVAIVLIIITHSTSILGFDNAVSFVGNIFYSKTTYYGLGLFTMLSGALQMKGKYSISEFYKKRFIRILVPFAFWATVVYVISSVMGKYDNIQSVRDAAINYIPALLFHRINVAYWYVYLILLLYVMTPLLDALFSRNRKLLAIVLVVWLVVETLFTLKGPVGTVVYYTGLYLLGFIIDSLVKRNSVSLIWGIGGFILLFAICPFISSASVAFILQLASLICLFTGLSSIVHTNSAVQRFSRYSYTIYLTHFIFIRLLFTLFPGIFSSNCLMPVLMAVIVAVAEYFFCLFLENCKLVPNKMVGI